MMSILFDTSYDHILQRIEQVDPAAYGRTRNFIDGAVTYLSPYISRGVISTKMVLEHVLNKGYDPQKIEKFIQELAWRDYWQQIWIAKGDEINNDLKHPQPGVENTAIPAAIVEANTGIDALDRAIRDFYETGYLHNHVRMYIAAITCNMGNSHWKLPAQWMYYHLLDGDWASNALSWQWVSGTTRNRTYVANQDNINKYCRTNQKGTFLDVPYEAFDDFPVPDELRQTIHPELKTVLPETVRPDLDPDLPVCLYTLYNMDPNWRQEIKANRVLLLEPEVFAQYPVSGNSINFLLGLGQNIDRLQVFTGSFDDFMEEYHPVQVYFKEHPLNRHYRGIEDSRDWMFTVTGYYPSFFAFWKNCKKEL